MGFINREKRSARISLAVMILGILALVVPSAIQADMMQWGFAVSFLGAVLAITAFFVFLMFRGRVRVRDRMFDPRNILAHWQYDREYWVQVVREEHGDVGISKIAGFVLAGVFLLIGIVVFAADPDDTGLFLVIMGGLAVLFVFVGFLAARAAKRRIDTALPEAIISREGLLFKNVLYTWNARKIAYLESVCFHPTEPSMLLFVIRQLSGGGAVNAVRYHPMEVAVPIPPGQEPTADQVVRFFNPVPGPV